MRIAEINMVDRGSTGTIMALIAENARQAGMEAQTFSRKWRKQAGKANHHFYGFTIENAFHIFLSSRCGYEGLGSFFGTLQLIRHLKKYKPDIVHLHNIHGSCTCFPLLFRFIKRHRIRVIWTLHDCWAFTGRCPYFEMTKCGKWKTGCGNCPYPKERYPKALVDKTAKMWKLKKKWFTGMEDMTIVTPSQWLANLVKESFLKEYPVQVIHNGIDLSVFQPTESDFRQKYGIGDKYMLLGVADSWGARKGLDVFVELSKRLDPAQYQIVLVGTNDDIDKQLPDTVISVHRTQNQKELAEIYTAADLFVNPTREENYPTVNMESIACGTPVLTFQTGGSPEIPDETCGAVVPCDNVDAMEKEIKIICENKIFTLDGCIKRAKAFDKRERYKEYLELYKNPLLKF